MTLDDQLLTPDDLAGYVAVPRDTLAQWRSRGFGPPYIKIGRHIRYRWRDVSEWLDSRTERPS